MWLCLLATRKGGPRPRCSRSSPRRLASALRCPHRLAVDDRRRRGGLPPCLFPHLGAQSVVDDLGLCLAQVTGITPDVRSKIGSEEGRNLVFHDRINPEIERLIDNVDLEN